MTSAKRMKKKGWSEDELTHLEKTLQKETKRDYVMKKNLHNFYYWTNIIVIILLNFAGILILTPVFLFMDNLWRLVFTGIFALSLGAMLNYVSLSMSHLELKHHLIAFLIIPFLVVADIFIFRDFIGWLGETFSTDPIMRTSPLLVVFVCCMLIPYLYSMRERMH